MCIGCGGTCADQAPRFTQNANPAEMALIGTNMAPSIAPVALVRQVSPGLATYQSLYTGLAPNGEPAQMIHLGTFTAMPPPAGRAR
jgi:hypothetical protein